MNSKQLALGILSLAALAASQMDVLAQPLTGKKVLYINSYHEGYPWSDGIEKTVNKVLKDAGVEVKSFHMDTSRQKTPEHLAKASEEAKGMIEQWKPDVVLVSDDPAMKGVYAPYFKDKTVPFVFCGVNWDAASYGVPNQNITGMLEICPIKELMAEMNKLKPGKTYGFLGADAITPRKDHEMCEKTLGFKMEPVFAKDFAAWKQGFQELQGKVDFVVLGPNAGLEGWDEAEAVKFAEANAKVVCGAWHDFLNGFALISYNKLANEQGEWAAESAIKIIKGAAPGSIPLAKNGKGELVINVRLAKKIGVTPTFEMLQGARVIE